MKLPNFTCVPTLWSRWAQHKNFVFLFLNLHTVISDLTQKISPTFWQIKLNEDRWSLKQCESTFYSVSNVLVCSQPKNKTRGLKVARYSLSRSIPPKFERKLCRHKQRLGKIDTTVVLDKDENLLWSGFQWHRSCHSNEITPLPILLAAVFLGTGNYSSKIVHCSFFLQ